MAYVDTKYLFKCETCRHCIGDIKCDTFCDYGEMYIPDISKIPTADVAEVKHGEWTKVDVMGNGYGQIYYQHKECPVSSTELFTCPYEYCPRCGAKMDGGKAE